MAHVISLLAVEDPTQTHSWILPETAEIIYGGLATVIVVSALVKFGIILYLFGHVGPGRWLPRCCRRLGRWYVRC
jgi:hypothetical protein